MSDQNNLEPIPAGRRYEVVVAKDFKATIPHHILAKLPEDERFLVETMSKLENQYEWLVAVAIRTNQDVLNLDSRTSNLEIANQRSATLQASQQAIVDGMKTKVDTLWDWKQVLSGKWAVVAAIAVVVVPMLLRLLFDFLVKAVGNMMKP